MAKLAQGIYITLEDGTHLINAVGGAVVACVGNSHPKVMQTIKDQVNKASCMWFRSLIPITIPDFNHRCFYYATI